MRWYMISNAPPWDNLKFDAKGVEEVQRKFFGTLYNTYQFWALYATNPMAMAVQKPEKRFTSHAPLPMGNSVNK